MVSVRLILVLLLLASPAFAAPTVFIAPDSLVVMPGQEFQLSIRVDAAVDTISAFLVEFVFDPDVLELINAEEGSLFANCGYPTFFHWDVLSDGWHSCNDVILGYMTYTLCPGELVQCEFRARYYGETPIEFTYVDLRDIRREPIVPVHRTGAVVWVDDGTGVHDDGTPGAQLPTLRASPNPFTLATQMEIELPWPDRLPRVEIFDVSGRLVAEPSVAPHEPCVWRASWDGTGRGGVPLPSGTYFVHLWSGGRSARKSLTLVK
jgi:hypothetical protein